MVLSVLIKPASSMCNMKCRYCFYHDLADNRKIKNYGFMQETVVDQIVKRIFEVDNLQTVNIAFQGGEPTLIGIAYYEYFIKQINKCNVDNITINYAIQTNGTKIDEQFIDLFKKHNFLVGISLDGMAKAHDAMRIYNNGAKTYNDVIATVKQLKSNKITYNVLTVVNHSNIADAKKLYAFYIKHGIEYVQLIPVLDNIDNKSASYSITTSQLLAFYNELFDLWYQNINHPSVVNIRFFTDIFSRIKNDTTSSCALQGYCSMQNIIEADGSIYPCDFYVGDQYLVGNVFDIGFKTAFSSTIVTEFIKSSLDKPKKCYECPYFDLCRGGCKRDLKMNCDFYYQFYKRNIDKILVLR